MGTGIDLFLDWENGIWVAGTGIWPLPEWEMKSSKMGMGPQYYLRTGILWRPELNSGFSDYACPQVRCTTGYMPGFRYILHLTLSIYLKGKAQQKIPSLSDLKRS